jgi:hypothetical protein
MANICDFGIGACGPTEQLEKIKTQFSAMHVPEDTWIGKGTWQPAKVFPNWDTTDFAWAGECEIDVSEPVIDPTDDDFLRSGFLERRNIEGPTLRAWGHSKWAPPFELTQQLSEQYPDVTFTLYGCTEHECAERWEFKGGKAELLDCYEGYKGERHYYVKDGEVVQLPLPEWIGCQLDCPRPDLGDGGN